MFEKEEKYVCFFRNHTYILTKTTKAELRYVLYCIVQYSTIYYDIIFIK